MRTVVIFLACLASTSRGRPVKLWTDGRNALEADDATQDFLSHRTGSLDQLRSFATLLRAFSPAAAFTASAVIARDSSWPNHLSSRGAHLNVFMDSPIHDDCCPLMPTAMSKLAGLTRADAMSAFALSAALLIGPRPAIADEDEEKEKLAAEKKRKKISDRNSRLDDKVARKQFDAAVKLAKDAVDEEFSQELDLKKLQKSEDRFTELIEEYAPTYCYAFQQRGNVRVLLKKYDLAIADYTKAIEFAPFAPDAFSFLVSRASTLRYLKQLDFALRDVQYAAALSRDATSAILERGNIYHDMAQAADDSGKKRELFFKAVADYKTCLEREAGKEQLWWIRYALDQTEVGQDTAGLQLLQRAAVKFDIEPEMQLAVCSLSWASGTEYLKLEAIDRYKKLPDPTIQKMFSFDFTANSWPPRAITYARNFLEVMKQVTAATTLQAVAT